MIPTLTPTGLHSPGLSRHKRLWCRALLCSNWMWWCGTSPDRPCPTEETKQSVSPAWSKTIQSLSALICLQPRAPYNLKLYGLSVQLDGPDLEVHTDGANVALCVRVILKPTHTHRWVWMVNMKPAVLSTITVLTGRKTWRTCYVIIAEKNRHLLQTGGGDKTFRHQNHRSGAVWINSHCEETQNYS